MRSPRGYSLQMVLVLLSVLAVAVGAMLTAIVASGRTTGDMLNRRRAFYACDGLSRVVVSLAQEYLSTKTDVSLRDYVCARGGGCAAEPLLPDITPPGFTVTDFTIATPEEAEGGVIPSGPFQGMRGLLQGVEFNLRSKKDSSGFVCEADQSVTLAKIAMFQFFFFGDGYVDWFPGAVQNVKGRAHANDDFCFGSEKAFRLSRVTSAGQLVHGSDPRCRTGREGHTEARILKSGATWAGTPNDDDFVKWNDDTDHGCTTCGGGGQDWTTWAATTWGANAQDESHGVPRLRLPITGTPETQPGRTAAGTKVFNEENSRLLVDPVRTDDGDDILRQKLACKADLRIINGVWYLRENPSESDPCDWPGTPIWSDHPGSFSPSLIDENGVEADVRGQEDLRDEHGWGTTPFRYSYYRTVEKTGSASAALASPDPAQRPVVSYGSLFRVSGDEWLPGHWIASGAQPTYCAIGAGGLTGFQNAFTPTGGLCAVLGHEVIPAALLNGTRSGFRNGHIEKLSPGDATERHRRSRVLPINFDVKAFIGALQDTDAGELGSYFGASSITGREFNGIVYVTSVWPGAMDGMDDEEYARFWPSHDSLDNSVTQPSAHAHAQLALPQPLCASNDPSSGAWGRGDPLTDSIGSDFHIPSCADFDDPGEGAWPNAVRVINARDLLPADTTVLPNGLTIATNLPAYLLGDVNATSDVSSEAAPDWKPFLIAGDQVTLLSKNWNDGVFGWNTTDGTEPTAAETRYHIAMLAGWAESEGSSYSGGIENFPRFLENWGSVNNHIVGSLVLGFHSVYYRWSRDGAVYTAPVRQWSFDEHFNSIPNQPPGAPLYDVYAIRRWRR